MQIGNNILEDFYSTPLPENSSNTDVQKSAKKEVEFSPKVEAIKGSNGLQKEVLGITSLNQTESSNRETAQKQLKNGYLDITI